MWESESKSLPSSKKALYISSKNEEMFCAKPGKCYFNKKNSWNTVKETSILHSRIDSIYPSPTGSSFLHLPKKYPFLAINNNQIPSKLKIIFLPITNDPTILAHTIETYLVSSGDTFIFTPSKDILEEKSFPFGLRPVNDDFFFLNQIGISCSDSGNIIIYCSSDKFWVWKQSKDFFDGIGYWIDLTTNPQFMVQIQSNHPQKQEKTLFHGKSKLKQSFTLNQVLSNNVPQNSAISYQDIAVFDNPEEDQGFIVLTTLLPPCKPFNTLYICSTICKFQVNTPIYEKYDINLPVLEGGGAPCVWWSHCCRIAILIVSKSLIILTRYLKVIKIIKLEEIFLEHDSIVSSISWSCSGLFFIITTETGLISALTRSGESLKHSLCHLDSFSSSNIPLFTSSDSQDPSIFHIYSRRHIKKLKFDLSLISNTINNSLSIHFPQGSSEHMFLKTIDIIFSYDYSNDFNIGLLTHQIGLYKLFHYYSPLRYILLPILLKKTEEYYENHQDIFLYFYLRCLLNITNSSFPIHYEIMNNLEKSDNIRDKLMGQILAEEINEINNNKNIKNEEDIKIYFEDKDQNYNYEFVKNDDNFYYDINLLINILDYSFFSNEKINYQEIKIDFKFLLDLLIQFGKFSNAINLSSHPSISLSIIGLYEKISKICSNDPVLLYLGMIECINNFPDDEIEIRSLCAISLNNILKNLISLSTPNQNKPKLKNISSLVNIEEDFKLYCPNSLNDCNDFIVIFGMCLFVLDFKNILSFLENDFNSIPKLLFNPIFEIFRLLWFIKWRFNAVSDLSTYGHSTNSTLRLLAFPEFINKKIAKQQILNSPINKFSTNIYAHYMNNKGDYLEDPNYIDFRNLCKNMISSKFLFRIHSMILSFIKDLIELPKSKLLYASIISKIIPCLKCEIYKFLVNYETNYQFPEDFFNFEELNISNIINLEITNNNDIDINNSLSEQSKISFGEFLPPESPILKKEESISSSSIKKNKKKKKKKIEKIKKDKKKKIEEKIKPLILDFKSKKSFKIPSSKYIPPNEDNNQINFINQEQFQNPPIFIPQFYDFPNFSNNNNNYLNENYNIPIWDIDPNSFHPFNFDENIPINDSKIKKINSSIQVNTIIEKPEEEFKEIKKDKSIKKSNIIIQQIPSPIEINISSSSEISDIPKLEPIQPFNFKKKKIKIDNDLYKRVQTLLNESNEYFPIPKLNDLPKLNISNNNKNIKIINNYNIDKSIQIEKKQIIKEENNNDSNIYSLNSSSSSSLNDFNNIPKKPDFYPRLLSIKPEKILTIKELKK